METLKAELPEFAKDIKLNLGSTLGVTANALLTPAQRWGVALACAVAARESSVLAAISADAKAHLDETGINAAKGAAAIMSMNNIYYRSAHQLGEEYESLPARLRMQVMARHGADPVDFELWCLAVSAVNGCGRCLRSHESVLRDKGMEPEAIQEAIRIAAVIHAVAVVVAAEAALP
ncbi:MAG TPA: carboxymuconolactone decarboxylase family protein [Mycobacteriales bacterium]|nr:carboxymuconolactone decarboxylase family protein [Mycobacteriales bacterium]